MSILFMEGLLSIAFADDNDLDGWEDTDTPPDCNDTLYIGDGINPGEPEDGLDLIDNDCDGSPSVRREYIGSFETSLMVSSDWTLSHASVSSGELHLNPTSTQPGRATFIPVPDWDQGEPTVVLSVRSTSSGCNLIATGSNGGSSVVHALSAGTEAVSLASTLVAGGTLDLLRLDCAANHGSAVIDWLTLQNGPYAWPPLNDLAFTFEPTSSPGGGRMVMVRASEDGSFLFAGSDTGGFAWSTETASRGGVTYGQDWVHANGAVGQWEDGGSLGVWDAWSEDGSEIFVLTGLDMDPQIKDDAPIDESDVDGLYHSIDLGETWHRADLAEASDDKLGANKDYDDCDLTGSFDALDAWDEDAGLDAKPIASGHLFAEQDGILYMASLERLVDGGRGLWVRDSAGELCRYEEGTLPNTITAEDASTYAGLPSALAIGPVAEPQLIVGYRVLAGDSDATVPALYGCPLLEYDFLCGDGFPECHTLEDTGEGENQPRDVRDVAPNADNPDVLFVVDGGRRPAGDETHPLGCTAVEPTVFALAFDSSGDPWIWDTDGTDPNPSWAGTDYYVEDHSACYSQGGTGPVYGAVGELVPPAATGLTSELVTVEVVPDGSYVLTAFPAAANNWDYGCARLFRAVIQEGFDDGAYEETLEWEPVQEWVADEGDKGDNARQRRDAMDTQGAWPGEQVPLAMWAGEYTQDMIFAPAVLSAGSDLVVAAQNLWIVPAQSGGATGWNSLAASKDLDEIPWTLAWHAGHDEFSDSGAAALATCPGCVSVMDDETDAVFATMRDIGARVHHGDIPGLGRPPADRDCHWTTLGTGGFDVAILPGGQEVWEVGYNQHFDDDINGLRTLLYSPDAGANWVWDAADFGGRGNFMFDDTTPNRLKCNDAYEETGDPYKDYFWYGSDEAADSFHLLDYGVGHISSIRAVAPGLALLTAAQACSLGDDCASYGGEGLWVVAYDETSGMEYRKVENFETVTSSDEDMADCDEAHFFRFDTSAELRLLPDSQPGMEEGFMHVLVVSAGNTLPQDELGALPPDRCGLREVVWTLGDEGSAVWRPVPYHVMDADYAGGGSGCDLGPHETKGMEIADDGRSVLLFGGSRGGAFMGPGGICEVRPTSDPPVWETSFSAGVPATYNANQVITPNELEFAVEDLLAQPHVDGVYFAVGSEFMGCPPAPPGPPPPGSTTQCDSLGLYVIQKRNRYGLTPAWGSRLMSGDELEARSGFSLTWGSDATGEMSDIYLGGAGVWDGVVSW